MIRKRNRVGFKGVKERILKKKNRHKIMRASTKSDVRNYKEKEKEILRVSHDNSKLQEEE